MHASISRPLKEKSRKNEQQTDIKTPATRQQTNNHAYNSITEHRNTNTWSYSN
jgi:hypothetical protein